VALYQAEYSGVVQYYRLAYNLHMLSRLKWVAERSLVMTLANKLRTSCPDVYRRFRRELMTVDGTYKVLSVTVERGPKKKPLEAHFGGISLSRNDHAVIGEYPTTIWSGRSELAERLLAEKCELCGSMDDIQVHHIHKLADLKGKSRWEQEVTHKQSSPFSPSLRMLMTDT
jgi:Type II intron maturase